MISELTLISHMSQKLYKLLKESENETFHDGEYSELHKKLVDDYLSVDAILTVKCFINTKFNVSNQVVAEAIRIISDYEEKGLNFKHFRNCLIEKCLNSDNHYLKDAAIIGISNLDDKKFIKPLKKAIKHEKSIELLSDMEEVLQQLENQT